MSAKNQHKLTPKQEAFARHVAGTTGTLSDAYRTIYSAARMSDKQVHEEASRLAANHKVAARIAELRERAAERAEISMGHTLREIARLAFFDVRKLVGDDGTPKPLQELDEDTAAAISSVDLARIGNAEVGVGEVLKVRMADKLQALEKLAKYLGLYEQDNRQKTDPLAELVNAITGTVVGPGGIDMEAGAKNRSNT